ncbi:MAG: acetyl-coenzyme A synthetase N-terminal domain-containing protein, partial [Opitutales bacterium]
MVSPLLAEAGPSIIESPVLVLTLAILIAFAIYVILRSKRKAKAAVSEEIADVMQASAEGFGSNEQVFPPSAAFVAKARVKGMDGYEALYKRSIQDPDGFWADEAKELAWFQPWTKVVDESKKPFFRWFVDGKTNVAYNCLDAQVAKGLGDKVAIVYEGEPTADGKAVEVRRITYRELLSEVSRFANVLKGMGLKRGDTVAIYMPMVPELAMA